MSYPVADNEISDVAAPSQAAQFDIKKFIFRLIGFLPWIIISTLVSYSIATLYLRYTAKVHRISAQLLIKDDEQSSPDANIIRELGVMPGSKEIQDQIDILQSYELSKIVVDSLHLQFEFIAEGRIASSPLYAQRNPAFIHVVKPDSGDYRPSTLKFKMAEDRFYISGNGENAWHRYGDTFQLDGHNIYILKNPDVKPNSKSFNLFIKDTRAVANGIKGTIDVRKKNEMGGTVEVSTVDEVPERGEEIINTLIAAFNKTGLEDKKLGAYNTNAFLRDKVDEVEKELDTLEMRASNFKKDNHIADVASAGSQYIGQIETADKEREAQEEQVKLLEGLTNYIKLAKNPYDIIPSNNGISDPVLVGLIGEYNQLVISYLSQKRISTEKDPNLEKQQRDLTNLKAAILKNSESIKIGFQTKLDDIASYSASSSQQLAALPEKERILVKLKRQIGVKESLYLFLLQKKYDAEVSIAGQVGDSRVVDSAHDQGVVKPQASQIKMFSILLGIFLPVLIMLLLDFFDNRLNDRKEVENGTRTPVLGELSYKKQQGQAIISPQSRNVLAEQFRLIRTNLQYFISEEKAKLILVTSFMSGEGKSFVSLNLIGSLVTGNKKVLLIEMDLRKPKLAKYLNIAPPLGLTDYVVSENATIDKIITSIPGVPNAYVITSGPIPPNPTELLMSDKISALFEYAKGEYDYIVLDSSPVGLVADAFLLGNKVDTTLFILRHKYSYKTTIKFIEKLYNEKKFNRLGIIINGIVASSGLGYGYGYGYGYSYGYGYHYGSGYYVEDKKGGNQSWYNRLFKK